MPEILSLLSSSPRVIGAILLVLGCILYATREYTPDWRLEKEKKANATKDKINDARPTSSNSNRVLLIPFIPLALVYLFLRLIWGLFKIGVFCMIDGILWTIEKIPSLFFRFSDYLTHLPETFKRIFPKYWEAYIQVPTTFILNYGSKVFFAHVLPVSTRISRGILGLFCRTFKYLWGLCLVFAVILQGSAFNRFVRSCSLLILNIFSWVVSRGGFLGKLTLECLQVLILDLFVDFRDLCSFVQTVSSTLSTAIKLTLSTILRGSKRFLKNFYSSCSHVLHSLSPIWEKFVQNPLRILGSRIREIYQNFQQTIQKYSIMISWGLCKITYRLLKVIIVWTWTTGIPRFWSIFTTSLVVFCENTFFFLCQVYSGSEYFYHNILKRVYRVTIEVHHLAMIKSLGIYRIVRNSFWNSLKFLRIWSAQLWIPLKNGMNHIWGLIVRFSSLLSHQVSYTVQFVMVYTTKCGIAILSGVQFLFAVLGPHFSSLGKILEHVTSLSGLVFTKIKQIMVLSQELVRDHLEYIWPIAVRYSLTLAHTMLHYFSEIPRLVKEFCEDIQPVLLAWKENIALAAEEVIQYLGRLMIDWMKSVKAKQQ